MITVPMEVAVDSPVVPISVETIDGAIQLELDAKYESHKPYNGPYEITPGGESQIIEAAGKYLLRDITVAPVPNNYGLITWNGSFLTVS